LVYRPRPVALNLILKTSETISRSYVTATGDERTCDSGCKQFDKELCQALSILKTEY